MSLSAGNYSSADVPRAKLGTQGLEVSKLGFGCTSLMGGYKYQIPEGEAISLIKEAFDKGITFFDTSDSYGPFTNEILLGEALMQLPRERIQVATKFGFVAGVPGYQVRGDPEYVRACCEASLERLGLDYIDLYYQHRVDTSVPIEETVKEMKKLVEEGKVRYIGLSEASPDTIRRAHAVHPVSAVQMEWSLWSRDIENEIVPLCRELGIGIVAYSPLGRAVSESLPTDSKLRNHPRFQNENLARNENIYARLEALAMKHGCAPAQLALGWLIQQGDDVVPIPGTSKSKNLDTNLGSFRLKLPANDLNEVSDAVPVSEVAGHRNWGSISSLTWQSANTPPLNCDTSRTA